MNKILVIEDHLEVRENVQELLELCDYHVLTASNGEEGVELALSRQPDLILCDITMPGIDGFEVLGILCQHPETSTIPFIFLSARTEKADIRKGMLQGADDYLTKPFEEEELLRAIQVRLQKNHLLKTTFPTSSESLGSFLSCAKKEGGMPLETEISPGVKKYSPGQAIFSENETPENLFFLASGKVRVFRPGQPGQNPIATIYEKGSFFGYKSLLQETLYQHRAEALEASEVSVIPKNDFFLLLLHNRTFSSRFIQMLANQVKEQEKQLLDMVQLLSQRAVAETILELYPSFVKAEEEDAIPMETLHSKTPVASINLTMALRYFDREKVIALAPHGIKLLDRQRLSAMASA